MAFSSFIEEKAEAHKELKNRTAFWSHFNLKLVDKSYRVDLVGIAGNTTLIHWLHVSQDVNIP